MFDNAFFATGCALLTAYCFKNKGAVEKRGGCKVSARAEQK